MLAANLPGVDSEVALEVSRAISEAVGRFGAGGDVIVEGTVASLVGAGPSVSTEIGSLVDHWDQLASELRKRRCTEVARRLVRHRRELLDRGRPKRGFTLPAFVAPVSVLALTLAAGYLAYRWYVATVLGDAPNAAAPVAVRTDEHERRERARRVCDATRSRVQRGAMIGPTDVEGWVVEMILLRAPAAVSLAEEPALGKFVSARERRVVSEGPVSLRPAAAANTGVVVEPAPIPTGGAAGWDGIRLRFTGGYVIPYFTEERRPEFVRFATALGDRLNASHGALFARCEHHPSHHLGAWFSGLGAGGAMASLLYFIGTHADVPHVRRSLLSERAGVKLDRAHALARLVEKTRALDRRRVAELLGPHGGMIGGGRRSDEIHAITFPFNDANRAVRASRGAAESLGIGAGL